MIASTVAIVERDARRQHLIPGVVLAAAAAARRGGLCPMTPHTRDEVALHIWERVKIRAQRKGSRLKRLDDKSAREGVVNGATGRLMELDAVFPDVIRRRLTLQRVGNITVVRNINPLLWLAWVQVHRELIELGTFWYEESVARDKLIDRALDAERKSYLRATSASGGSTQFDPTTQENLERFTGAGNVYAFEEQEQLEAEAEDAAVDAREKIEAEENTRLRDAVAVYERKLRRKHRAALRLVCGPRLPNGMIAARCGVAEATVAKIRADVCDIADGILTNPEDVVETLLREVESLKKDVAVLKAERRRDRFLRDHSSEEFEALRVWAAPFCEALGQSVDDLLGATIAPKRSDQ